MKVLEKALTNALINFFNSKEGIEIMFKVINNAFIREMRYIDGKSEPGKKIEKTEHVNVLNTLMKYLPDIEAAIRGCQADSAMAKNRAIEARDNSAKSRQILSDTLIEYNKIMNPYIEQLKKETIEIKNEKIFKIGESKK